MRSFFYTLCIFVLAVAILGMGPKNTKFVGSLPTVNQADSKFILNPNNFRCILVGDSQTTTPDPERIRTQTHRWDVPFVGQEIVIGASSSGYTVNNFGITNLAYHLVDLNSGWNDGGSEDFFAPSASEWVCVDDVQSPGSRFGRYRINFGSGNINAPYSQPWGVGVDLVARIAVRTGPGTVPAVETRAERGGTVDSSGRITHQLDTIDGIQILEQPIPASIDLFAEIAGVGLYLPSGSIEQTGQTLQVLGVIITRAGMPNQTPNGFMMSYQGRGGWNIQDHLTRTSNLSRRALVRMTDATHVMIMLGHNREPEGSKIFAQRLAELVSAWEASFVLEGYQRPTFVFVVPWPLEGKLASEYLSQVNTDMRSRARLNHRDVFVSFYDYFSGISPEIANPGRYTLDGGHVHPGDIDTAVNLSDDLFHLLFPKE